MAGRINSKAQQEVRVDDPYAIAVFDAWNILGGEVRIEAVPHLCEFLGWDDPESLLRGLIQLRDTKVR